MGADDGFDAKRLLESLDFAGLASEQEQRHRRETTALLQGMLDVLDSLEALRAHCDGGQGTLDQAVRSANLIVRQGLRVLADAGVTPMDAVGKPLDLTRHDVVDVRAASGIEEDVVLEEAVRGYLWGERVLRRAKVVIAGTPHAPKPSGGSES